MPLDILTDGLERRLDEVTGLFAILGVVIFFEVLASFIIFDIWLMFIILSSICTSSFVSSWF